MKEIGLKLKNKREENGVSIEEAAEDLKMRPSQISSLEEGKKEDFQDVLFLKYFIRDYAKYLGLDSEKLLDEFNEFMFDFTSKISLSDIEKAKEEIESEKKNEIKSPYTKETKNKINIPKYVFVIIGIVLVIFLGYMVISNVKGNDFEDSDVTYSIRR